MSSTDTGVETTGKTAVAERVAAAKPATADDVRPAGYDVPEGPVSADALSRAKTHDKETDATEPEAEKTDKETPDKEAPNKELTAEEKEEARQKAEIEAMDEDELREELELLNRELFDGEMTDEDQQAVRKEIAKKKPGDDSRKEMEIDWAAEIRKAFIKVWMALKKLFKAFAGLDVSGAEESSGEEVAAGFPEDALEGRENEDAAIKRGLKRHRWRDLWNRFRGRRGKRSELTEEANALIDSDVSYRIKPDDNKDVSGIVEKHRQLAGRRDMIRSELLKRNFARRKSA